MGLGLLAIGLVAFMALGPDYVRGGAANYLAKLWINDSFPGTALFSDGVNSGWYIDHRISPPIDPCVTAWVGADGGFFIYMDYTGETGHKCSESLGVTLRTYTLIFPAPWGNETVADHSPRMRIVKLFGRKGTTLVAFMFYKYRPEYEKNISYEVRPDTEVPTTGSGNTRTLTYYGTATLWRITQLYKGEKTPVAESGPFSFPFEITVVRVPQ